MKRLKAAIFLGFLLFSFGGCNKDDITNDFADSTSVVGTWELRQAQNGMTPTIDYSPGNGNILKFSNSSYKKYTNNSLVNSGQYIISEDPSVEAEVGLVISAGQFTHKIVYDNDFASGKIFIQISTDKLSILSGYFPLDGGSYV